MSSGDDTVRTGVAACGRSSPAAAEYGYLSGEIRGSSGHLRVNVQSSAVPVDYVRSYLPDRETVDRKNGEVTYSYLINDD